MPEPQQTFTFRVPIDLNQAARNELGGRVINFIKSRTNKGLDKNNRKFAGYSDSYINSKDFEIAGKSTRVNLQLTGDMLTDLEVLNTTAIGFITIGFRAGEDSNDRASYQRNNLQPGFPKRDFLGITDSDLSKVIRQYLAETSNSREVDRETSSAANAILSNFINDIFNG